MERHEKYKTELLKCVARGRLEDATLWGLQIDAIQERIIRNDQAASGAAQAAPGSTPDVEL